MTDNEWNVGDWPSFLAGFNKHVYPIFAEHGFSRDTALQVWFLNWSKNAIYNVEDAISPPREEAE